MSNDLISRSALIAEYCDGCDYPAKGLCDNDVCGFALLIKEAPAVDAVEVVRCKDCEHFYDSNINPNHRCKRGGSQVWDVEFTENDFCSYGKRRTDQ